MVARKKDPLRPEPDGASAAFKAVPEADAGLLNTVNGH